MATLTLDLNESLLGKLLNSRNAFNNIYNISGGFGKMTQVVTLLNKFASRQINTADCLIENFTIDHQGVISKVKTRTASGTNLILEFYDTTYNNFRIGDAVFDSARRQGYVNAHSAGQITIEPLNMTTFAGTDFPVDTYTKRTWDVSSNRDSVGKESLFATPDVISNYGSIKRDSVYLARRDFYGTYMDNAITQKNWAMMQEKPIMTDRVAQGLEWSTLFEEKGKKVVNGKETNQNGGLLWGIQNRGGTHTVSPNDLTETTWQATIEQVKTKRAVANQKLTLFYGTAALATLQSITTDFIKQAGSNNTFGGSAVSGINVQTYSYLGVDIDFIYLPILDDEKMFPEISDITGKHKMSSSFFLLDLSPTIGYEGSKMIPAIQRFHFDIEGMRYGYIPGMIGPDGGNPSNYFNGGRYLQVSDIDGVSCHVQRDGGIDVPNARGMLFWELLS